MTLDEAIKHAEEVAELNEWFDKECLESIQCRECAEEHRQLAEWLKDYKRLLEQEPKTGHWISVSERLPETDDDVLVYDGVDMFVAWYSLEGMWQGWNSCDDNFDRDTPIIAWMPLPVPYKPESEVKENEKYKTQMQNVYSL